MKSTRFISLVGITTMVCLFSCGKDEPLLLIDDGTTRTTSASDSIQNDSTSGGGFKLETEWDGERHIDF
jgi:hypothetical protein